MADKKNPGQKLDAMNKRADGLVNILTRENVAGADKQTGYRYQGEPALTYEEVTAIYRTDGFGRKIVDRPVEDMVRNWIEIKGDSDGDVNRALLKLGAKKAFKRALTWAQVYGGGVIVMIVQDGGDLEEPLNEKNIQAVESLQVYDRHRVSWSTADLYSDPTDKKYLMPEIYKITPIRGTSFGVHETRILRFDGIQTDDRTLSNNDSWSDSVYQAIKTHLVNLNGSYHAVKSIIDDFIQIIISIEGLQDMVAAGQDDIVKERLNLLDLGRHTQNTLLLDANEQYTKSASTVTGLEKLIQEFQLAVSAVVDIPVTILMGRSPAGMSSTGESDIRQYYDSIKSRQEEDVLDNLTRLAEIMMLSKQGPTKGSILPDWSIKFNPLWEPSQKEVIETRKMQAEIDDLYTANGVLTAQEVAKSRFEGEYSYETEIDAKEKRAVFGPPATPPKSNTDAVKAAGVTSKNEKHTHDYILIDSVGNGQTGKDEGHFHPVLGFKVEPYIDKEGRAHTHKLEKE